MKKILGILAALVMTLALSAAVAAEVYTGKCGTNATWSFDTDTGALEIGGSGAMANYN